MRGGMCQVSHKLALADKKHVTGQYDPAKPSSA